MKPKAPASDVESISKNMEPEGDVHLIEKERKLRRRVEDRIRKDREALYLVARVLNIE